MISALKYPLAVLVILTVLALFAQIVAVYVAPFESEGAISFTYNEGQNPITHLIFTFDNEMGETLIIQKIPEGWSLSQSGAVFSLSGGRLLPGASLMLITAMKQYVDPGERPYTVTATTTEGSTILSNGVLTVKEMTAVTVLLIFEAIKLPLLIGTIALGAAEAGLQVRKRRRTTTMQGQPPVTAKEDKKLPKEIPPILPVGEQTSRPNDYVIYVVSDLHMGSNLIYEVKKVRIPKSKVKKKDWTFDEKDVTETTVVNKSLSNLFNKAQADRFRAWLKFIDAEIESKHPNAECDLIINGDFLDLWQAKVPAKISDFDTENGTMAHIPLYYTNRIDLILDRNIRKYRGILFYDEKGKYLKPKFEEETIGENPNYDVIVDLIRFASKANRTVFYLVGNHDDALYDGDVKNDPAYGYHAGDVEGLIKHFMSKLEEVRRDLNKQGEGIPSSAINNFIVDKHYWNRPLSVYAEHGHLYDEVNWKEDGKPSNGQKFVEDCLVNMQENGKGSFWGLASEPYNLGYEYLESEYKKAKAQGNKETCDLIEQFVEDSAEALGYGGREELASAISFEHITLAVLRNRFSKTALEQDEDLGTYFKKSEELKNKTNAAVLTFGHTHRPIAALYSDESVYVNTGEWIYNIKFDSEQVKLEEDKGASDQYLKIEPWRKLYDYEAETPKDQIQDYMRVELYSGSAPPFKRIIWYKVKKKKA